MDTKFGVPGSSKLAHDIWCAVHTFFMVYIAHLIWCVMHTIFGVENTLWVSGMTVSVPWLEIPRRPMRSREKLAGDWSFGDDVSGILSVLISNRCSFSIFW